MTYKTFLTSAIFLLSSCVPMVTAPPTVSPTSSPILSAQTESPSFHPTPSPTLLLINPLQLPTPINTPHSVPTAFNVDPIKDPSVLHNARVEAFKDTLSFKITTCGVGFEMPEADQYIIYAEGILTNTSNKPIVVRRELSSGRLNEDVSWNISYNRKQLNYPPLRIQTTRFILPDGFVVLQPNEFQKYLLGIDLPFELSDDEGNKVSLSNKRIQLTAKYFGFDVGYVEYRDDRFVYVDINAWVGFVESNPVECVFP